MERSYDKLLLQRFVQRESFFQLTYWNNVKLFVELLPLDLSLGNLIDERPIDFVFWHFADVVDANVELVPLVDERVTAASGLKWVPLW